jgi:hypothetical protein
MSFTVKWGWNGILSVFYLVLVDYLILFGVGIIDGLILYLELQMVLGNVKGKAIPLQALTGPEGSRRLRLPDFIRHLAHEGGKVVSPRHRPPLPPGNIPGTHFC